jgi:hypothetical protein
MGNLRKGVKIVPSLYYENFSNWVKSSLFIVSNQSISIALLIILLHSLPRLKRYLAQ